MIYGLAWSLRATVGMFFWHICSWRLLRSPSAHFLGEGGGLCVSILYIFHLLAGKDLAVSPLSFMTMAIFSPRKKMKRERKEIEVWLGCLRETKTFHYPPPHPSHSHSHFLPTPQSAPKISRNISRQNGQNVSWTCLNLARHKFHFDKTIFF